MKKIIFIMIAIMIPSISAAKVPNPFVGTISPDKIFARPGTTVPVRLVVETMSPFARVEVAAKPAPGLKLVEGKSRVELADFKPGEKKTFDYKVLVKDAGEQRFMVTIKALGLESGVAFGNAFITMINPEDKPTGTEQTMPDGTKVFITNVPSKK